MAKILDGRLVAESVRKELKTTVATFFRPPHLVVFLPHPHPASITYVKNKLLACKEVGIAVTLLDQPCENEQELLSHIELWNQRDDVDGILVQFPVHPKIDQRKVMHAISPHKDVDGTHPENLGKLVMGDPSGFCPCTPLGIQTLLSYYHLAPQGQHVVIVGRSVTVGKPLALLLSQTGPSANATVTLANRSTRDLVGVCKSADIVVAAVGSPHLIKEDMVKEGAIVIDVGINRQEGSKKLIGDVDFQEVSKKASWITPVPGGVGPMTIASLLSNTVKSYALSANRLSTK